MIFFKLAVLSFSESSSLELLGGDGVPEVVLNTERVANVRLEQPDRSIQNVYLTQVIGGQKQF